MIGIDSAKPIWFLQEPLPDDPEADIPHPYFVTETGDIAYQEFWRGRPKRVLGFADKPVAGRIDIPLESFLAEPAAAEGRFPVFADAGGAQWTSHAPIAMGRKWQGEDRDAREFLTQEDIAA